MAPRRPPAWCRPCTPEERDDMRTLAITQNITVDGSIEMITDWFSPLGFGDADTSDLVEESHRQDSQADALLLGRQTFEDFRGFWPQQTEDTTGVTDYLNRVQKYVVSTTLADPQWENSTVLSGDPVAEVTAPKEQPGKAVGLTGRISLAHTPIAAAPARGRPRPSWPATPSPRSQRSRSSRARTSCSPAASAWRTRSSPPASSTSTASSSTRPCRAADAGSSPTATRSHDCG